MTFIEVQQFGDFDILITDSIMFHHDSIDVENIEKEFYKIQGIESDSGLSYEQLYDIIPDFIAFLELKGFQKLDTIKVCFSS
jgi:hypothetical protein